MRNILLAISGLTPQIVTETFFALSVQKKIKIDEIFVITTELGKKVLEGKTPSPAASLKTELKNLCKDYNLPLPKFTLKRNVIVATEETTRLYDVKTDRDNVLFPNKAAEIISKLTADAQTALHVSLSGGRKSMSAHLALVLSLFARSQDKLYHVLTDEKFESQNFYPKSAEELSALVLAEIPFVKLRSLNSPFLSPKEKYYDLVCAAQKRLSFLTDNRKLIIELKQRTLHYGEDSVRLTPKEIALYIEFVEAKIAGNKPLSKYEIISPDFALKMKNTMEENFHQHFDPKSKTFNWTKTGLDFPQFLTLKSKINKKIDLLFNDDSLRREFEILTDPLYGGSKYYIKAPKEKLAVNYE